MKIYLYNVIEILSFSTLANLNGGPDNSPASVKQYRNILFPHFPTAVLQLPSCATLVIEFMEVSCCLESRPENCHLPSQEQRIVVW